MLFSEYILSLKFDMGYLRLEDIYADDVEKYGHMRVGMTDLYVKDNHAFYGVITRDEYPAAAGERDSQPSEMKASRSRMQVRPLKRKVETTSC